MSRHRFYFRAVVVTLLLLTITTTAEAAARRRAADRGPVIATLSGKVTDAVTGEPVFNAAIGIGLNVFVANKQGEYKIDITGIPPNAFNVTVFRWGYHGVKFQMRLVPGPNFLNAQLQPKPVASLMDLSGRSYRVDAETARFHSWFPLASPVQPDPLVFYLPDGTPREVPLSQLKAIVGPGVPVASPTQCFYPGTAVRVGVILRSGELLDAIFPECEHYLFVLSARDRDDGEWHYLKFSEIALIEYP